MSTHQIKLKQLRRLKFRNIFLNTVCILLALAGISWTVNYFWKYARYEITNDAVVDQYIAPLNIRIPGYIKEVRFTEHQYVHAGDTLLILDDREYRIRLIYPAPEKAGRQPTGLGTGQSELRSDPGKIQRPVATKRSGPIAVFRNQQTQYRRRSQYPPEGSRPGDGPTKPVVYRCHRTL